MDVKTKNDQVLSVSSETGILQKVLMHRPDTGIERVTPARAVDLLYEDIVYLPKMTEEHDVFTQALSFFVDKSNVVDVEDLLGDILEIPQVRKELADLVMQLEKVSPSHLREVYPLEAREMAHLLITGIAGGKSLFNPLPNLIFTRDIGVMINEYMLICLASKQPRRRESLICSFIFSHHPMFKELSAQQRLLHPANMDHSILFGKDNDLSIEGGDVMLFSKNHLIIAGSERTTIKAFERIRDLLFYYEVVDRITFVDLPKDRYCMHLDTVFTKISSNDCVGFGPLIMEENRMPAFVYTREGKPEKFSSLKAVLMNENPWMNFIPCGEGISPFDEREQWTDGCNLFAVKEAVAFTYDRNIKTNDALRDHGYRIIGAGDLIEEMKSGRIQKDALERTIITIPSSELSRARGGPHCMTMPLARI